MDRDTIIRLARDAAFHTPVMEGELLRFAALIETHLKERGYRQCAKGQRTTQFCGMLQEAVKAEREACARVCEHYTDSGGAEYDDYTGHGYRIAAAIRSRT